MNILIYQDVEKALSELKPEQIDEFKKYFDGYDLKRKGVIQRNEVGSVLQDMGHAVEEKELKSILKEFDGDGKNKREIKFEMFLAVIARCMMEAEKREMWYEECRRTFQVYDKEGNGYINIGDLKDILRALDEGIPEEELDEILDFMDCDQSGTVDFEQFMEMMSGGNED